MINVKLFEALERRFGKNNVAVFNEDEPAEFAYEQKMYFDAAGKRQTRLQVGDVLESGEEYRVSCPECNDTRQRLYINHRWGVFNSRTGTRNLWLANCYNENCFSDYQRQLKLYDQVYNQLIIDDDDLLMTQPSKKKRVSGPATMPGAMWHIKSMLQTQPRHGALDYLRGRFISPERLVELDVQFCTESSFAGARRRWVAPIYLDGVLKSWQARYVGQPEKGTVKWFTCPGTHVGDYLYNIDIACQYNTVVLVEGPSDVWSFGPQATAVFGKSLKQGQLELLVRKCRPDSRLVIMFDPEWDETARRKGKPHHIEKAYDVLRRHKHFEGRVIKVYLPCGHDPGSLDGGYMRRFIRMVAREQGFRGITFKKPVETRNAKRSKKKAKAIA